jgi:hypothetical protein
MPEIRAIMKRTWRSSASIASYLKSTLKQQCRRRLFNMLTAALRFRLTIACGLGLGLVTKIREAKRQNAKPRRSHNQRGKCSGCRFRKNCSEARR